MVPQGKTSEFKVQILPLSYSGTFCLLSCLLIRVLLLFAKLSYGQKFNPHIFSLFQSLGTISRKQYV